MKIDYSRYEPVPAQNGMMAINVEPNKNWGIVLLAPEKEMERVHHAFIVGIDEGYRLAQQHFREMLGFPTGSGGSVMD